MEERAKIFLYIHILYNKLHFINWSCEMPRHLVCFIANVSRQISLSLRKIALTRKEEALRGPLAGRTFTASFLSPWKIAKRNLSVARRLRRVIWLWSSSFLRRNRRELSCPKQPVRPPLCSRRKTYFLLEEQPRRGKRAVRYEGASESVPERLCQRVASTRSTRNESWWI